MYVKCKDTMDHGAVEKTKHANIQIQNLKNLGQICSVTGENHHPYFFNPVRQ